MSFFETRWGKAVLSGFVAAVLGAVAVGLLVLIVSVAQTLDAASIAGQARIDGWNRQQVFCADHGYTDTRWLHEHVYCYKLLNGSDVLVKIEDVK